MKFKVGDKVKITKAMFERDKKYEGKVVTINWIDPYDEHRYRDKENGKYWRSCELKSIEEEIMLKGVKKHNVIYEMELPKENNYIWCDLRDDKIIIGFQKKEEILDDIEKEYLRAVIKPFRDRVKYIKKNDYMIYEFISINIKNECLIIFPKFKKGTMYKGMEVDKKYTLEELGL